MANPKKEQLTPEQRKLLGMAPETIGTPGGGILDKAAAGVASGVASGAKVVAGAAKAASDASRASAVYVDPNNPLKTLPREPEFALRAAQAQAAQAQPEQAQAQTQAGHPLRDAIAGVAKTIFSPFGRGGAPSEPQTPAPGSNPPGSKTPVSTETKPTTPETPPVPPGTQPSSVEGANNVTALNAMGVPNDRINMPAVGGGEQGRRAVIQGGSDGYVNLGNYGNGPNIYGKSGTVGGRMDTFVGAGYPDPNNPTTDLTVDTTGPIISQAERDRFLRGVPTIAGRGNARGGGGGGGGGGGSYNNANPYGGSYSNANPYGGGQLRASQPQFGGGAGGRGTVRTVDIRRINQQANDAFNQALKSGMNTKAALRIAENIRAGAENLINFDKNLTSRDTAQTYADASRYGSDLGLVGQALRGQQALAASQAEQQAKNQDAQFSLFQDQYVDAEGKPDKAGFARMVQAAGGRERFANASPETQQILATRGSALNKIINNVNNLKSSKDLGIAYSTIGEITRGATLKSSDATLVDAIRSPNIDVWDAIFNDKITLPDGQLITPQKFFGVSKDEWVRMSPEDRKALVEVVGD